jgi:hypothetical protein
MRAGWHSTPPGNASETGVGASNAQTKATAANGIAYGVNAATRDNSPVNQANTGLAWCQANRLLCCAAPSPIPLPEMNPALTRV